MIGPNNETKKKQVMTTENRLRFRAWRITRPINAVAVAHRLRAMRFAASVEVDPKTSRACVVTLLDENIKNPKALLTSLDIEETKCSMIDGETLPPKLASVWRKLRKDGMTVNC